jgi:hypothetical protein
MKYAMLIQSCFPRRLVSILTCALALVGSFPCELPAAEDSQVVRIVNAADNFLKTLNDSQRKSALFKLDDAEQRVRWSNLPVSMAEHGGLRMGDLTAGQRAAVMALLEATLSKMG